MNVLIVDDNRLDAELVARELRRSGIPLELRTATRESEFRGALTEFAPDVVLCDFSFPDFDGLAALQIAHELRPGIPVIFVTGTISEERAVVAARNGAVDYVLKHNLIRLPDAVTRAVAEAREKARRHAAEEELEASRQRLTALMDNVDSALSSFSLREMRYHYFSPAARRVYGRPAEEFYRNDDLWLELLHPDDLAEFLAARERLMADGSVELEYRVIDPDGAVRWVNHRSKIAHDAAGTPVRIDTIGTDVTERKQQQRQLERLSRIRDVFAAVNSAIVRIAQPAELCQEACRIARDVGGFPLATILLIDEETRAGRIAASLGGHRSDVAERRLHEALEDPDHAHGIIAESMRLRRPAVSNDAAAPDTLVADPDVLLDAGVRAFGSFPFEIGASRSGLLLLGAHERDFFNDDEIALVTGVTNNLSFALELAEKRERLDYLAYYDPLTELPNRTLAAERVSQQIAAAERRGDRLALVLFDLRRFAYVNATHGEAAGDDVLRALAARLRERIGAAQVARIAGDRFAIVIPELRVIRDVMSALSSEGLKLLAEPIAVGGRDVRLTAHVGCAVYPNDGTDAAALFRNAEAALQSAKGSDAPYRFYAPELDERLQRRLDLEARLRRAVAEHEFVLHYQPKVELRDRAIAGVEALIRWRDPSRPNGLVPPGEFIPVLEETGLIVEVGRWALEEAARQHHAWRDAGLKAPRVAVNVSAVQLAHGRLLEDFAGALAAFPDESGVDIEVTESGVMSNVGEAVDTLRAVRELGAAIALDDFGTGYSSLSYIFHLPISTIKIDRSFINGITSDADKLTIVSTVISLGRELKLQVVAEGVETEEQAKLLSLLRCDQIQGFLIARPMPSDALTELLAAC